MEKTEIIGGKMPKIKNSVMSKSIVNSLDPAKVKTFQKGGGKTFSNIAAERRQKMRDAEAADRMPTAFSSDSGIRSKMNKKLK